MGTGRLSLMPKFLSRWGRAFGRIFSHLAGLHRDISRSIKLLTWALGILGLASLPGWAKLAGPWLATDLHWLIALLGALLLGASLALYGVEREADMRATVRLLSEEATTDLRETLHFNDGDGHDVLIVEVIVRFYNGGDKLRRVRFPTLTLQERIPLSWKRHRWEPLTLIHKRPYYQPAFVRMFERGLPNHNTIWYRDKPFEIPAFDELSARFHMLAASPDGAKAFIGRPLRLAISVEIIGQERPNLLYLPIRVAGYTT
jgi:hypothetical protein